MRSGPRREAEAPVLDNATPGAHVAQFYEDDAFLLDQLVRYVADGLAEGDAVLVVATRAHLDALAEHLDVDGIDVTEAREDRRYVALEAEATLARFMVDGVPNAARFTRVVGNVVRDAVER